MLQIRLKTASCHSLATPVSGRRQPTKNGREGAGSRSHIDLERSRSRDTLDSFEFESAVQRCDWFIVGVIQYNVAYGSLNNNATFLNPHFDSLLITKCHNQLSLTTNDYVTVIDSSSSAPDDQSHVRTRTQLLFTVRTLTTVHGLKHKFNKNK